MCPNGSFSGNWESWNFLDTFNHSKNILRRKNVCLTVRTFLFFFRKIVLLYLNRCKTSLNKDKLVLFFPPERWVHGQKRLRAITVLLTVWHACKKNSKKFEKCVGFSTSRSERVKNRDQVGSSTNRRYLYSILWLGNGYVVNVYIDITTQVMYEELQKHAVLDGILDFILI